MTTETQKRMNEQQTEMLIDRMTLPVMAAIMAEICFEKAAHIRENWQDENMAKLWDKNGEMLANLSPKLYS
jgi:hypothetical protein